MADANDFIKAIGSSFGELTFTVADNGQLSADSTGEQLIRFDFCLTFMGREAFTLRVAAPSPEASAATVNEMVRRANETMPGWGALAGECPSGV